MTNARIDRCSAKAGQLDAAQEMSGFAAVILDCINDAAKAFTKGSTSASCPATRIGCF